MGYETIKSLSRVQQEYIETIYSLCQEQRYANSKLIAEKLNIKMPSVTSALQSLAKLKLIEYRPRHPVVLTPLGLEVAKLLVNRQKVLFDFFYNILGLDFEYAEKMACGLEHSFDEAVKERLKRFNQYLKDKSNNSETDFISDFKKSFTSHEVD